MKRWICRVFSVMRRASSDCGALTLTRQDRQHLQIPRMRHRPPNTRGARSRRHVDGSGKEAKAGRLEGASQVSQTQVAGWTSAVDGMSGNSSLALNSGTWEASRGFSALSAYWTAATCFGNCGCCIVMHTHVFFTELSGMMIPDTRVLLLSVYCSL